MNAPSAEGFMRNFAMGVAVAIVMGAVIILALSMAGVVTVSVRDAPLFHQMLGWLYDNLRLSILPFSVVLILYAVSLRRLRDGVRDQWEPSRVAQAEHWVDLWISLFFGIGVIWTAIGMRSALLEGLGDLDAVTAAQEGAFSVLRRLIDGGILLALSTTIVGGVGGYLLRVMKSMVVGSALKQYFAALMRADSDRIEALLGRMDEHLALLAAGAISARKKRELATSTGPVSGARQS